MNTFYLVRHGKKEKGVGDVKLSTAGIQQAQKTAVFFKNKPIKAVFSSPLKRSLETAACISAVTGSDIKGDIRLRERANWGDMPDQSFDDFVEMWNRCTHDRDYIPTVGDSARRAGQRVERFISECTNKYPDSEIVAVLHGGVITDFLINVFSNEQLNDLYPDFVTFQSELIPECSITVIRYDGLKYYIDAFAEIKH
jgi:broad specificity phosphatase PhoE